MVKLSMLTARAKRKYWGIFMNFISSSLKVSIIIWIPIIIRTAEVIKLVFIFRIDIMFEPIMYPSKGIMK